MAIASSRDERRRLGHFIDINQPSVLGSTIARPLGNCRRELAAAFQINRWRRTTIARQMASFSTTAAISAGAAYRRRQAWRRRRGGGSRIAVAAAAWWCADTVDQHWSDNDQRRRSASPARVSVGIRLRCRRGVCLALSVYPRLFYIGERGQHRRSSVAAYCRAGAGVTGESARSGMGAGAGVAGGGAAGGGMSGGAGFAGGVMGAALRRRRGAAAGAAIGTRGAAIGNGAGAAIGNGAGCRDRQRRGCRDRRRRGCRDRQRRGCRDRQRRGCRDRQRRGCRGERRGHRGHAARGLDGGHRGAEAVSAIGPARRRGLELGIGRRAGPGLVASVVGSPSSSGNRQRRGRGRGRPGDRRDRRHDELQAGLERRRIGRRTLSRGLRRLRRSRHDLERGHIPDRDALGERVGGVDAAARAGGTGRGSGGSSTGRGASAGRRRLIASRAFSSSTSTVRLGSLGPMNRSVMPGRP